MGMNLITNDLVSVIVPCYNTAKYVRETMESIFNQTYKNLEIILVDDGSTDNTPILLNEFRERDSRVKIVRINNGGVSNARMTGYKQSTSKKYVVFLDSDDTIAPTYIEKCIIMAEKGYDIVYTKARYFDARKGPFYLPEFQLLDFLCGNCITVTSMIRKSLFDLVGGYDTKIKFMEDWDCYISLIKNGAKVYRIPEELFFYRKRADASSSTDTQSSDGLEESFMKI